MVKPNNQLSGEPRSAGRWLAPYMQVASYKQLGVLLGILLLLASGAVACGNGPACPGDPSCPVDNTVTRVDVTSQQSTNIVIDTTVQLTATAKNSSGATVSGKTATWSSDLASIAAVDGNGLVTAKAVGTAVINAEIDGVTGTMSVNVAQPMLTPTFAGTEADGTYSGLVDRPVNFSGASSTASFSIEHYWWNFGDNSPEVDDVAPSHTYPASLVLKGTSKEFQVTLRIVDSKGNEASATVKTLIANSYTVLSSNREASDTPRRNAPH